jgi:hypothetical protein
VLADKVLVKSDVKNNGVIDNVRHQCGKTTQNIDRPLISLAMQLTTFGRMTPRTVLSTEEINLSKNLPLRVFFSDHYSSKQKSSHSL